MSEVGSRVDRENIEYVRTHDLEPYIARAIEREQIVRGMTPDHVRFLKGEPGQTNTDGDEETWTYGTVTDGSTIVFRDGKVVEVR